MPDDVARLPGPAQWTLLAGLAAALALGFQAAGVPAAGLLGPMAAGIGLSLAGGTIRLPRAALSLAQSGVGCLIATLVTPGIVASFLHDWPLILGAVLATLAASSLLGWTMSFWRVLPGSTAIWGTAPGGASAMVVMAEAFGADGRMVALMQYLRVILVAGTAALIAHLLAGSAPQPPPAPAPWFPPVRPAALATAVALVVGGAGLARLLRVPGGPILLPMGIGAALHSAGLIDIQMPPPLLAVCYGAIGCGIGLGFTRAVLVQAAAALPKILLSIVALIALCGLMSLGLVRLLGLDPLTAYLAMSPGGIDSVAVIGAASGADLSFVMALQTMRLLLVVLLGPGLARLLSRGLGGPPPATG